MKKIALIAAAAAFATATTATAGTYTAAPADTSVAPVALPAASSISGPILGLLLVGIVVAAASSGD